MGSSKLLYASLRTLIQSRSFSVLMIRGLTFRLRQAGPVTDDCHLKCHTGVASSRMVELSRSAARGKGAHKV
jgi:hypothetical protein